MDVVVDFLWIVDCLGVDVAAVQVWWKVRNEE